MTKFKPGDQVICINDGPLHGRTVPKKAPEWLVKGRIYTVSALHNASYETENGGPRLLLEGLEGKIPYLERFELYPPPEADADYLEILDQQETYLALKD